MVAIKNEQSFLSPLAAERKRLAKRLEERWRETVDDQDDLLATAVNHALAAPGKYIRSLLMLDSCRAVGGDPEVVLPAALGVEYGHLASLIHDDIMDGDTSRRGQDAVYVRYGLDTAMLAGDALIFLAFLGHIESHDHGASAERTLAAIRELSLTCIAMCRGQSLESAIAGELDVTEEQYFDVIRMKTAAFCRAVCEIGALLGGGGGDEVHRLGSFGEHLGVAFQIMDDVLCYGIAAENLGKPSLSDFRNRRVTLPIIYALHDGAPLQRDRIRALFASSPGSSEGLREQYIELARILAFSGALDRARTVAQRHTYQACERLDALTPSDSRDRLAALAMLLIARDR